jgi:hypothetical protein
MARNKSAFELMVDALEGKYFAPLKEGQINFDEAICVTRPCFLKDGRYPIKMDCVREEDKGEVIASVRWLREEYLLGDMPLEEFKRYILLDKKDVFSHFPKEQAQTSPKCMDTYPQDTNLEPPFFPN